MDKNFEKGLKFVLAREGGYSNHPSDSGGETNKGITHKTYDALLFCMKFLMMKPNVELKIN